MPVELGRLSVMFGVIAIVRPNPASCAVLDEGESVPFDAAAYLSDDQYLTRCAELSKLLL